MNKKYKALRARKKVLDQEIGECKILINKNKEVI